MRDFKSTYDMIQGRSVIGPARCRVLYDYIQSTETISGDIAEVGVYKGGTVKFFATLSGKLVHGFDTFCGLPIPDKVKDDYYFKLLDMGDPVRFSDTSFEDVRDFVSDMPNVLLYAGMFPATAAPIADRRFSFVHIDADLYASVLAACEFFYPRMSPGGVMLSDDYGSWTCAGAKIAMDEFFSSKPESVEKVGPNSQVAVVVNG